MTNQVNDYGNPPNAQSLGSTPDGASDKALKHAEYWKINLKYLAILLSIWFVVSYGFGILLAGPLNAIVIFGFPLGFWFAQQGSIYTFVALIFIYVRLMNTLDKRFDVEEH